MRGRGFEGISVQEIPYSWARKELVFAGPYQKGAKGKKVKCVQEWLCFHGIFLSIDGTFGPITEKGVREFQGKNQLEPSGVVNTATFERLTEPMSRVLLPLSSDTRTYGGTVIEHAHRHLAEHPREMGGENRGPWVRLYMKGNEGKEWLWCAGFVSFIMQQAADTLGVSVPIAGSFSCDALAERAMNLGFFVSERDLSSGKVSKGDFPAGSLFLSRRSREDWTHVGVVTRFEEDGFETVEGNTNDEGSREGYEVCKRLRGYKNKDFIRIGG